MDNKDYICDYKRWTFCSMNFYFLQKLMIADTKTDKVIRQSHGSDILQLTTVPTLLVWVLSYYKLSGVTTLLFDKNSKWMIQVVEHGVT